MTLLNTVWIWICFFLLIAGLTQVRPRYLRHRVFSLLRVFIPSWRFFDEVGPAPRLYFRVATDPGDLGAWLPIEAHRGSLGRRSLYSLFLNPDENLFLAGNSLVAQLLSDIEDRGEGDSDRVQDSVSYRLVERWVRWQFRGQGVQRYQFKISLEEDLLLSPELEIR